MSNTVSDVIHRIDSVLDSDQTTATTESLLKDISTSQISSSDVEINDFGDNSSVSDSEMKKMDDDNSQFSGIKNISPKRKTKTELETSSFSEEESSFREISSEGIEISSFVSLFNSKYNCSAKNLDEILLEFDKLLRNNSSKSKIDSQNVSGNQNSPESVQKLIEKLNQLEKENKDLKDELNEINEKYNKSKLEIEKIEMQSTDSIKQNNTLQNDIQNLQNVIASMRELMENQLSDISSLGKQRYELVEIVNKQTKVMQSLEALKFEEMDQYNKNKQKNESDDEKEERDTQNTLNFERDDEAYTILTSLSMLLNESLPYDLSNPLMQVRDNSSFTIRERILLIVKKLTELITTSKGRTNEEIRKSKQLEDSNAFYKQKCFEIVSDYQELLHFLQTLAKSTELQKLVSGNQFPEKTKDLLMQKFCQLTSFVEETIGEISENKVKETFFITAHQKDKKKLDETHIFDLLTSHEVEDQVQAIIDRVSEDNIDAIEMTNLLAAQIFVNNIMKHQVTDLHERIAVLQKEATYAKRKPAAEDIETLKLNKQLLKQLSKIKNFLLRIVPENEIGENDGIYLIMKKAIRKLLSESPQNESSVYSIQSDSSISRNEQETSSSYKTVNEKQYIKEIKQLVKRLNYMEKQYKKLVDKSNEEKESHRKDTEKNRELQERVDELESQIRDSQSQISQLQTEANTQNVAAESARAIAERSTSEHSVLKEEYNRLQQKYENDVNHYKQQLDESNRKLQIMTNTIEENYQILDKIKKQRHVLGKQIERLQSANNMLQETIDYQSQRLKRENADSIAELQVQLATAQKELAKQSLLYDELNNKCKQLQSDNASQIAARKTAEFKCKSMEEKMEIEKKSYESRVSATANAAQTAKENIQLEANKQIHNAIERLAKLLSPSDKPSSLDDALSLIERDVINLRNAQAAYISTIDSVIRAQKLLKVRSPTEIAGAVELLLDKLSANSVNPRQSGTTSNSPYNDAKQEIERLKRQIRVNDSVAAQLKQWETWGRRLSNIIHDNESLKSRDSNYIRISLEECVLASVSHRAIFNRVESLRTQKRILLAYDRRLLLNYSDKMTMRNLIIVSVAIRRIQKLSGCISFAKLDN